MPDVKVEYDVGTELSYQLSDKCSQIFNKIFSELESRSNELGVDSYGVSLTTLEEVFMKVGTDLIKSDNAPEMNGSLTDKQDSEFGSETTRNCITFCVSHFRITLSIFSELCCRYSTSYWDAINDQSSSRSFYEKSITNTQKLAADVDSNLHSGTIHYDYRTIGKIKSLVL